jgi:SAM-dependent methyltransferase
VSDAELERIRAAYRERDAAEETPYRWDNPAYVAYMQDVERALLRAFADAGVDLAGARVLDVGCGSGYFLQRLHEYGAGECHGIDLMENRIAEGRERYPALHFHLGSATELPFADGEFDLVCQFTCLSSIVDPEVRLAAAREMQRVAAGGWVLSLDMRGMLPLALRRTGSTPTVGLDNRELQRLFGGPALMRRVALAFDLTQRIGRHTVLTAALGTVRPLRSHLLGLWRVPGEGPRPTAREDA